MTAPEFSVAGHLKKVPPAVRPTVLAARRTVKAAAPIVVMAMSSSIVAKAYETESANANLSNSPTLMASMPGTILGTAAYMSPEQATGTDADRASDVWAFGCVLYEMLTGRRPYIGKREHMGEFTMMMAIVHHDVVEPGVLRKDLPPALAQVLEGLRTDAQRALQFVRSTPGVGTALCGMRSLAHVEENAGLVSVPPVPSEKLFSQA